MRSLKKIGDNMIENNTPFIHPAAIVETEAIGKDTRIWAFVHVLKGAVIGNGCNICGHCYIEYGVTIGNNVTVKSGIYIWEGVTIEDDVFLGPNVVFTNDIRPRSKQYITSLKTTIQKGASIGANSTLLAGITLGQYCMTGIGSVVTRNVPAHALVYGNPARIQGWVDEEGQKLLQYSDTEWRSEKGIIYAQTTNGLKRK
jgi:acetyltransferase-like isoleucine patch superfamily enzyme